MVFSHLSSTRASMAKSIWKSIKARLAWRAFPSRSPDDKSAEGLGGHSLERINGARSQWLHTVLDEERCGGSMDSH